jgi:hypothetical protein
MAKTSYPSGPINQHKALATGKSLPSCDTSVKCDRSTDGWGKSSSHPGRVHKSGTSTGSK